MPPEQPPSHRNWKWWIIGAVVVVFGLPFIISLIATMGSHNSNGPQSKPQVQHITLADTATVNTAHLPSSKILFFTMLQRTAEQPTIAGYYGAGYYSNDKRTPITETDYQLRELQWQHGKLSRLNYSDAPWDPSNAGGLSLSRCVDGVFGSAADYAPAWKDNPSQKASAICRNMKNEVTAGDAWIDNIITGGLTATQASDWANTLAASNDSHTHQPLFSFKAAQLTTLNGKQVIKLAFSLNQIGDNTYCDYKCGAAILRQAMLKVGINAGQLGYDPDPGMAAAVGEYYINPSTLLPVQSQITTYGDDQQLANEYRKQFQYTPPDFNSITVHIPAAQPALLHGFTHLNYPAL